jgi:hypothetical protein
MGAAALMQHDWQQSGDAPVEAAQADAAEQDAKSAAGHEGTNGFAEGHSPGVPAHMTVWPCAL